ncbi:MAG: hypothetical protein MUF03_14615 [Rubrivivax sp.]|nr:hypothetical protein [Rubrivivax sp.]
MPPPDASSSGRAVDSAVQPCPPRHRFALELLPADATAARPAWWPPRPLRAYAREPFDISLAGVGPSQRLDGAGSFRASGLPGGDAEVEFAELLSSVEDALARGRRP